MELTNETAVTKTIIHELRLRGFNWRTFGAVFGLCGGFAAALLGCVLTVITWLSTWHVLGLQRTGTGLFVVTFPLLIFGAHCMDLLDRQNGLGSDVL